MTVLHVDSATGKQVAEYRFHGAGHHGTRLAGTDDVDVFEPLQIVATAVNSQQVPFKYDMAPDSRRWIYGLKSCVKYAPCVFAKGGSGHVL